MTREERYKKLDEKRPLKYGSHRESLLRYERYVKKYNSMVKKLPGDKDIEDLISKFSKVSVLGKTIDKSDRCRIVICKLKDSQLYLAKGYTYEWANEILGLKAKNRVGFYSLEDFLMSCDYIRSIELRLNLLHTKSYIWWETYKMNEKNEEYISKLNNKKPIGEYIEEFRDKLEAKFMDKFGLDVFDIGPCFDSKDWIEKLVAKD